MTPEQFMRLSMEYDPMPVLASLNSGGGITTAAGSNTPWANMTQPSAGPGAIPGAAPLDPKSMMALNSMMPQQAKPQYIGGSAPRAPGAVNMQTPDIMAMMKAAQMQQGSAAGVPPPLAQIIGGR